MIFGIFAKPDQTGFSSTLRDVLQWLKQRDCRILIEESLADEFRLDGVEALTREEIPSEADTLIVFGGDGTMLSVARLIQDKDCPILGVNLGTLGFLTEVALEELYPALERVLRGEYTVDERCMLQAKLSSQDGEKRIFHAMNDVVVNKAAIARAVNIDAYFEGSLIADFLADGVIVSTPTGSTAYSLSAGGPIVYPSLDSILVTPICPHMLTNRPLIIPSCHSVRFVIRSGEDVMVTIDGQVGHEIKDGDSVTCTRSPYRVRLIRPDGRGFFDILQEKLKWGKR